MQHPNEMLRKTHHFCDALATDTQPQSDHEIRSEKDLSDKAYGGTFYKITVQDSSEVLRP